MLLLCSALVQAHRLQEETCSIAECGGEQHDNTEEVLLGQASALGAQRLQHPT